MPKQLDGKDDIGLLMHWVNITNPEIGYHCFIIGYHQLFELSNVPGLLKSLEFKLNPN
jgi:hypothetical protein